MPQVDLVRERSKKPMLAAAIAGLVVVALVVAVFWIKLQPKDTADSTTKALNNAADSAFSGNNDAAIATLNAQLKTAKTNDEKHALYMALGAAYETKGENKTAVETYKKAEAIESGFGVNEAIARSAEADGDKATALDYNKRNRELIKSGKASQHSGDLPDVEAAITRLGGKL